METITYEQQIEERIVELAKKYTSTKLRILIGDPRDLQYENRDKQITSTAKLKAGIVEVTLVISEIPFWMVVFDSAEELLEERKQQEEW